MGSNLPANQMMATACSHSWIDQPWATGGGIIERTCEKCGGWSISGRPEAIEPVLALRGITVSRTYTINRK